MMPKELTPDGIQKFLLGQKVILQAFGNKKVTINRRDGPIEFLAACLSDGFAYLEDIFLDEVVVDKDTLENSIVQISICELSLQRLKKGQLKQGGRIFMDSDTYALVTSSIPYRIGQPIKYDEFVKNGKKNPKGNRKIVFPSDQRKEEDDTDEEYFQEMEKMKMNRNKAPPQGNQNSYSNNSNASRSGSVVKRQNSEQRHVEEAKKKPPQKPIIKVQEKTDAKRNSVKQQICTNVGEHHKIGDLFLGIESFRLVARLLFIWPIKSYTNKKGIQSEILKMEFGDDTGTIMCTVFGESSSRYCNLILDSIYSIEGAAFNQSTYRGVTQKNLIFGESAKVNLIKGDIPEIPTLDKMCITLRELNQCQKGQTVYVKCLLKQGEFTEFISKNGNKIKKKVLKMYDIQNQIECELSIIGDKTQIEYVQGMYAIKGIQIGEYMGNKQFQSSLNFIARYLKNHPYNKRIKEVDELTFTNIGSNRKKQNRESISSFSTLVEKCDDLKIGDSIWSEVICYLKAVRIGGSSKNFYLSCPHCKKKITEETATDCLNCKKDFERPKYRYLLSVNLADDHDNIWVNTYDEGEKILALPGQNQFTADSFAQSSEDALRQRVQALRYKRLKVKLVSNQQTYNNETRLKHKVVRVLPISYEEENKKLLEHIKSVVDSL